LVSAIRACPRRRGGTHGSDPVVLTTIPPALFVIALVASFVPARRASRIDPLVTLRE
jgi:hypothetical protein